MRFLNPLAAAVLWGLALLLALAPMPAFAQNTGAAFVEGFDDLPLMPALTQDPDGMTVFDSPYGRIVDAYAGGRASAGSVRAFYDAALPQLGWRPAGPPSTWRREGQILTLDVTPGGDDPAKGTVTVRFHLSPTD